MAAACTAPASAPSSEGRRAARTGNWPRAGRPGGRTVTAQSGIGTVGIGQSQRAGRGHGPCNDVHDWWTPSPSGLALAVVLLLALECAEPAGGCGVTGPGVAGGRDPADSGWRLPGA